MSQKFDKLKALLKELFQLDQPDLDFGIYRILHARSSEVLQFLDQDLLPQVRKAFEQYQPADKAALQKELAKAIEQAQALGADSETLPKVKELRAKLDNEAVDLDALESEVYDHLYSFFRRYYSEGDFLSKRVYKPGVYAIPYEGEEVKLHWANSDQYYIKTSEYLRDYAFRLQPENEKHPMRVHFKLVDASEGEHGNVKATEGKDRVFILAPGGDSGRDFIAEQAGELVLHFEYRPAVIADWPDGGADRKKPPSQKDLLDIAVQRIGAVSDAALVSWIGELNKPHIRADGERADYTRLRAHLNRYTARNTFDYFIHKDLGSFLRRELDFYIKNEVMHLDDIESESAPRVEQYLSKIKVIRGIAGKIIEFLTQLEEFQKKLWLKKKFVIEANYCVRLGVIPEAFYPEIAANEGQNSEWIRLFAIDEIKGDLTVPAYSKKLGIEFLKAHSTLVVDTRFFSPAFKDRLIEALGDLQEGADGLILHGENFHALSILQSHFRSRISCVYIDPPYNAPASEVLYKNEYKHSSWLSLMQDRIKCSVKLLSDDACYAVAIDDYELVGLCNVLDQEFLKFDRQIVVVNHHPQGGMSNNLTRTHEYMIMLTPHGKDILRGKKKSGEVEYRSFMLSGPGDNKSRSGRPNSFYAVLIDEQAKKIVGFEPPPAIGATYPKERTKEGYLRRYPVNEGGEEKVWCRSYSSVGECFERGEVVLSETGGLRLAVDTQSKRHSLMSNWTDSRYNAGPHGTGVLAEILGDRGLFPYPKSLFTVRDAVESMTWPVDSPVVLDFFGGSGTTGHAVIMLNREDGGRRKFVLVEQGDYIDTVLLPRIKKITFSPEWENGKPKRLASKEEAERSPRIVKVMRLESYEDALNNLELSRTEAQQDLLGQAQAVDASKEQYFLRYMLDVEARGSQSLLNVQAFSDPTAYKLKVKRPGSDESREVNVDLLETFNWLIGLTVQHIAAPQVFTAESERDQEGRLQLKGRLKQEAIGPHWFRTVTGTTPDGRKALIIWRKLTGNAELDNLVLDEWFKRQAYSSKDAEFDLIYVNGDNNLENLKAADETWKVRLIEEDFHRLMFDTEGA